jgi:hypothetical protein
MQSLRCRLAHCRSSKGSWNDSAFVEVEDGIHQVQWSSGGITRLRAASGRQSIRDRLPELVRRSLGGWARLQFGSDTDQNARAKGLFVIGSPAARPSNLPIARENLHLSPKARSINSRTALSMAEAVSSLYCRGRQSIPAGPPRSGAVAVS